MWLNGSAAQRAYHAVRLAAYAGKQLHLRLRVARDGRFAQLNANGLQMLLGFRNALGVGILQKLRAVPGAQAVIHA